MSDDTLSFEDYLGEKPYSFFEKIEDGEDFKEIENSITDQDRWSTTYSYIFKYKHSERFIEVSIRRGSTEYQEHSETIDVWEVTPKEVTTTIYVSV